VTTRYRAGYDLERATRILLEANGYLAIRSSGSKGVADLVALKKGEVLLVQCKTSGRLGPGDRAALHAAAERTGATALAVRWAKNGHQARYPEFIQLTSPFTSGFRPWTPDYALETA
jgi:Holliday junction resolvase